MHTRKIIFSVFTDHTREIDLASKSTFKASEIVSVRYKFISPYVAGQKLAVMRPDKDIVNIAIRDIHGDSGNLTWEGLTFNGRCDLFLKTPDMTSCRVIGVVEVVEEANQDYVIDPRRSRPGAQP